VHVETDAAGRLADHGALLERVVDALDRVVGHREEEARGELRSSRARVEERRRGVREPLLREEVVRLHASINRQ